MGEHELPRLIAELLRPMLARFLAERAVIAHAGADPFFYWEEGDALYPTEAEAERAEKEQARADGEKERAGRLAAEAEVARLRALLGAR